jgi:pseudaminic acid synthase
MNPYITISGRRIGYGYPTYIVAEISANHGHNFDSAAKLVRAAKEAGADAVKLQTYTAATLTIPSDRPPFRISGGTLWDSKTLYELYTEAYTPWEWHLGLQSIARQSGLDLFSTPFDVTAIDLLEGLGVPAHKVASFELVDVGLIRKIAATGKPIIMSTGLASLEEIEEAVTVAREAGAREIALLKCTSAYPASPEEMNLRTIADLGNRFQVPSGLSDHTLGIAAATAAVAVGASIIEKHITLSRSTPGPDSAFSLEPQEFREMVAAVRTVEAALGQVHYGPSSSERKSLIFRRSLFVVKPIKAGEKFSSDNVRSIRPAHGLHPRYLDKVLRSTAACDIDEGTPLTWEQVVCDEAIGMAAAASATESR